MFNIIENLIMMTCGLSAIMVLIARHTVQSLLSLILTFGLSSILFMILGTEFISLLILIVYIGAIAVMFLFVIMMLNIKIVELRSFYLKYLSVGIFLIFFFFFELLIYFFLDFYPIIYNFFFINWLSLIDFKGNIYIIAIIIYYNFFILFFILALLLFIAMIGSIVLLVAWGDRKYTAINKYYYFESYNKNKINNLMMHSSMWK